MMNSNKVQTAQEIACRLSRNSAAIIGNLKQESIDVYQFLQREFRETDVSSNNIFQFVFKSYYGMNYARLSAEFKKEFFRLMQEARGGGYDLETACKRLYSAVPRKKSLQFSFSTKLLHTIDCSLPIYDGEVASIFGYRPPQGDVQKKLPELIDRLDVIKNTYSTILKEGLLESAMADFDSAFPHHQVSDMKRLDFIFWSAGKILPKQ